MAPVQFGLSVNRLDMLLLQFPTAELLNRHIAKQKAGCICSCPA